VSGAEIARLRGEGRWDDALALADDPLLRADLLNEQALFAGSSQARELAARELDRAEARLQAERGRILHARFLAERGDEDPRELEHFEASLELARRAGDERLEAWARFWIGIVHQVVRDDQGTSLPHFEAAYTVARECGDSLLASYAVRHPRSSGTRRAGTTMRGAGSRSRSSCAAPTASCRVSPPGC
jgi:hypothetical protein